MLTRQNPHVFLPFFILSPDDSAGRIERELWWTIQEFCLAGIIILPWFSMLLSHP
jgi:hypothetical protein